MSVSEVERTIDDGLTEAREAWAASELASADALEKARGISENLLRFIAREEPTFRKYFVRGVDESRDIEEHFRRIMNIPETVPSDVPQSVLKIGEVSVLSWSNLNDDGTPFDVFYEARIGNAPSEWYQPPTVDVPLNPSVQA